jgi:hypothetical protein
MKPKINFVYLVVITLLSLVLLTRCAKNVGTKADAASSQEITETNSSCPVNCHDIRCKFYGSYCGPVTPVNLQTPVITSQGSKDSLRNAFIALASSVNMTALSAAVGTNITIDSIDFVNIGMAYDANDTSNGSALIAPFKSNSNSKATGYGFALVSKTNSYTYPVFVSTNKPSYFKIFDLKTGVIMTCNNPQSSTASFSYTDGTFVTNGNPPCGQKVADCLADKYTNHGWLSVANTVFTGFFPWFAVAMTAGCTIKQCIVN